MPIEAKYRLTRRSIDILASSGFKVSIQTKSPLILRDTDLIVKYRDRIDIGFTITTLDPEIKRVIEPRAPHPLAVVSALRRISSLGVSTWIFIGPIIPHINDDIEQIEEIVKLARDTNSEVIIDLFRERTRALRSLEEALGRDLVKKILRNINSEWWSDLSLKILEICDRHNVKCSRAEDMWRELSHRKKQADLKLDLYLPKRN